MSMVSEVVQMVSAGDGLYGIDRFGQLYKFYFGDNILARSIEEVEQTRFGRPPIKTHELKVLGKKNVGWQLIEDHEEELPEGFEIVSD